jgi:hypothetical protein
MSFAFTRTLKFQLNAVLALIVGLFAAAAVFTFHTIQQHRNDNVILNLANKLQLTTQQMATQALNYIENAPRNYDTYYRDVRLYYRDLKAHMDLFDRISGAFMTGGFPPDLTNLPEIVYPLTNEQTRHAVNEISSTGSCCAAPRYWSSLRWPGRTSWS